MERNTLYIAYGSNLDIAQMSRRCPGAKIYGVGRIEDYRLAFKALGTCAYATIEPCEGDYVPVGIWKIGVADEGSLDRYEGYPTHYYKEMIEVIMEESKVQGMVYVMNKRAVPALPARSYIDCILSGYDSFGLEEEKVYDAWSRVEGTVEGGQNSLQYYRHKKGLTQRQLAEMSGVSVKSIQNYECSERDIMRARAESLLRLAKALEISPFLLLK